MEILSKVLPIDVIGKVRTYHSHPIADLFKQSKVYKLFHEALKYNLLKCSRNNPKRWNDHEFIVCCIQEVFVYPPDNIREEWHNYGDYREYIFKYSLGMTFTTETKNESNNDHGMIDSDSD